MSIKKTGEKQTAEQQTQRKQASSQEAQDKNLRDKQAGECLQATGARSERQPSAGQLQRDLFWNTAGSLIYALSSMVLAFFVMRMAGAEEGGIFGFGFSTFGQQMFIVAYFGIRPVQITDVAERYSFAEYRRLRIVTCLFAAVGAFCFLALLQAAGRYTLYKAAVIWLLALYKIADGFADVYESECQRAGKLYLGGRGLCFRTLLAMLALMAALLISGSLLLAAAAGVAAQILGLWLFNMHPLREQVPGGECLLQRPRPGKASALCRETALLFVSVFLDFYVFSAAKYAIDARLGDAASGVFNILFMPTSVIYLVANFVIKPFMTQLAAAFEAGDRVGFCRIRNRLTALIAGLTLLALCGVLLLGRPVLFLLEQVLGSVYSGKLTSERFAFLLIILGGGVYALANLYYYILVILRRQRAIFLVYALAALFALLLAGGLVSRFGMIGAAACYLLLMLCLLAGFLLLGQRFVQAAFAARSVAKENGSKT